jgi:hypothetical protein
MDHFGFSNVECEAHRDSNTPYALRVRAREEQAFYERFGKASSYNPALKHTLDSVAAVVAAALRLLAATPAVLLVRAILSRSAAHATAPHSGQPTRS